MTVKPSLGDFRRRAVETSDEAWVRVEPQYGPDRIVARVTPTVAGVDLAAWVAGHRDHVESLLLQHGGLLFRGFSMPVEGLETCVRALSGEPLEYTYGSTPRTRVSGRIYTSTEYPADQSIPMHNEISYAPQWPMKLWLHCVVASLTGGETPLADSRRILARIPPRIRERFTRHGLMYVRNYNGGMDVPWQKVFQTEDRAEVEAYCASAGMDWEWLDGDRLRTRQVCQAVARHPRTGETVWFNQANLFHVSRWSGSATLSGDDVPRNVLHGDGTPIEAGVIDEIQAACEAEALAFRWEPGDTVVIDNMLVAHSRRPFTGPRRIVVGMAELHAGRGLEQPAPE